MVNQALISLIFCTTSCHDSVELRNLGRCRPVRSFCEGKITVPRNNCGYVNTLPAQKKPQGPVTLLQVTHLVCSRSISRSRVGLRGPRALGHVFGKRFVLNRYEEYVRCDVLEHNLVFLCLNEWVSSHNVN